MGAKHSNDGSLDLLKQHGSNSPEEIQSILEEYKKHMSELYLTSEKPKTLEQKLEQLNWKMSKVSLEGKEQSTEDLGEKDRLEEHLEEQANEPPLSKELQEEQTPKQT